METHTIKLKRGTYDRLEEIRVKKETYDDAVTRLLSIYTTLELIQHKIAKRGLEELKPGEEAS